MNTQVLSIGIVAGEESGDLLGASLIAEIRSIYPNATFRGMAGPEMLKNGRQEEVKRCASQTRQSVLIDMQIISLHCMRDVSVISTHGICNKATKTPASGQLGFFCFGGVLRVVGRCDVFKLGKKHSKVHTTGSLLRTYTILLNPFVFSPIKHCLFCRCLKLSVAPDVCTRRLHQICAPDVCTRCLLCMVELVPVLALVTSN